MRSGRDGPVEADDVDETLVGLAVAADGEPPKKSRPNKEFAGSACLVDEPVLAGAERVFGVSVVLGLAGGDGISPNISWPGGLASVTVVGRAGDGNFCCEAERSSFAFSWTTFRGWETSTTATEPVSRLRTHHIIIAIVV